MSITDPITELILETFRLNGALLAAGDRLVSDLGLTSARWQVLGAITYATQPIPVSHIARNMGLTRQAVQRLVNEMIADGLLRLMPNPHHRRARLVVMTETGRMTYTAAMARQRPWVEALGQDLTAADVKSAHRVLAAINLRLLSNTEPAIGDHDVVEEQA